MNLVLAALVLAGLVAAFIAMRRRSTATTQQPQFITLEENSAAVAHDGSLGESIGISIVEGDFAPLLNRGASQPAEESFTVSTSEDNQEQITLHFYRGNANRSGDNAFLGDVRITGYPLAQAQEPLVRVFVRAADGRVSVAAVNERTGAPVQVTRVVAWNAQVLQ
jgi:molecular chaperone DnaK (HSP70)